MPRLLFSMLLCACVGLLLGACDSGDRPLGQVDPDAAPREPTFDQVFSIIQRECVPCHEDDDARDNGYSSFTGSPKDPRVSLGARVEPGLGSCATVIRNLGGIEDQVFEKNRMPPGAWPRLTEREKLIIRRWIDNGAPAPCD